MRKLDQQLIIFSDLDGTLLDHNDYSIDAVVPVLNKLTQRSVDVIPTTSKTFSELQFIMPKLGLNTPFIIENGAAVFIPKTILMSQPEGTESIQDYWQKSFTQPRSHWQASIEQAKRQFEGCFSLMTEMSATEVAELTGLTEKKHNVHCNVTIVSRLAGMAALNKNSALSSLCSSVVQQY